MTKLEEIRHLIEITKEKQNDNLHDCLVGLMCLSSSEFIDEKTYDEILEKIKKQIECL